VSAASSAVVAALVAHGIIGAEQQAQLRAHEASPWWLLVLQALAAWFASLLMLSSFMLPAAIFGDSPLARALAGALLCGAAIGLFRRDRLFTSQMALAFSLAGQALLVSAAVGERWAVFFDGGRLWATVGIAAAAAMMLPRASLLHRTLCGLLVMFHAGFLIGRGPALEGYGVLLAALAAMLWLSRPRWAAGRHADLTAALARAAALAALALPGALTLADGVVWGPLPFAPAGFDWRTSLLSIGAALVFAAAGGGLLRDAAPRVRWRAVAAGLLLALASQPAPGLIVAATLFLACFHAGHRLLAAVAVAAAVLYVGEYYYRLEITLMMKSALLAASGLVLLGLRWSLGGAAEARQ
jgi:hypothetical protein